MTAFTRRTLAWPNPLGLEPTVCGSIRARWISTALTVLAAWITATPAQAQAGPVKIYLPHAWTPGNVAGCTVIEHDQPSGPRDGAKRKTYDYDRFGNLVSESQDYPHDGLVDSLTCYRHDAIGRVLEIAYHSAPEAEAGVVTRQEHDREGRLVREITSHGAERRTEIVRHGYAGFNRNHTERDREADGEIDSSETFEYFPSNQLREHRSDLDADGLADWVATYEWEGRLLRQMSSASWFGPHRRSLYAYDERGRRIRSEHWVDHEPHGHEEYELDEQDLLVEKRVYRSGHLEYTWRYAYDTRDRVTREQEWYLSKPGTTVTWTYHCP